MFAAVACKFTFELRGDGDALGRDATGGIERVEEDDDDEDEDDERESEGEAAAATTMADGTIG